MKKCTLLAVILTMLGGYVLAAPSNWSLEKKIGGPASWPCAAQARLEITSDKVEFYGHQDGPSIYLENINKGVICHRSQNGAIFGHLGCTENVMSQSKNELVIESFTCGSDLPFVRSCNPRAESPSNGLKIDSQGKLVASVATGGRDNLLFVCAYRQSN